MTLPIPGGDDGIWGELLNLFLLTSLTSEGALTPSSVADALVTSGDVVITDGVAVLQATSPVETIMRNQFANLSVLSGTLNANGQLISNQSTPGFVLAQKVYCPTTPVDVSITSATPAVVDSSNLTTSPFVATTTQVTVELQASGFIATGSGEYYWTVFEHGSTTPLAAYAQVGLSGVATSALVPLKLYVPGLTVGSTYQFDWAHCTYGTSPPTGVILYGGGVANPIATEQYGPAIMTVKVA